MNRIVISGASGDLGRKLASALLSELPPEAIVLATRSPAKLAEREDQGVAVRYSDYRDRASLDQAFAGCDTLMLISGLDVTNRVPEHRNAIAAAQRAGISHIVYTSVAGIHPRNPTLSASDHIQTEADLRSSGIGCTILRNQTYSEIIAGLMAAPALASGEWISAAGEGHLAPVSKQDIVRCAARCLIDREGHAGATYEITGPELLTFRKIAAMAGEVHGVPVAYSPVSQEERLAFFDSLGYPRTYGADMQASADGHMWASDEMVSADLAFAQDFHAILSRHVEFITGRPPISLREVFEVFRDR